MQLAITLAFTFLETLLLNAVAIALTLTVLLLARARKSSQEARTQRIYKMPFALLFSWLCIYFSSSFILWLQALDTDSFIEVQGFDLKEAGHFLNSFPSIFHTPGQTRAINNLYILLIWFGVNKLSKVLMKTPKRASVSRVVSIILLCVFFGTQAYSLFQRFSSRPALLVQVEENFNAPSTIRAESLGKQALTVVTYIGESTTKMNMSLYGYYRNTTPQLDALSKQPGFIQFDAVYSTHTHTTPSLLQALSIQRPSDNNSFDIFNDKRLAITEILSKAGIHNSWVSNQTAKGAWNQASKIFSDHASYKVFSTNNALAGNYDNNLSRPYDHQFFQQEIEHIDSVNRQAIFLHSYAGHGPYLQFIPEAFKAPVDDALKGMKKSALLGRGLIIFGDYKSAIENYDSAIRYIDSSVVSSFKSVEKLKPSEPVISIYFSDHGESVYTAAGHDSSRLLFEMVAVPFVIYFNDAAKKQYPGKFKVLSNLAKNKSYSLEILSPILNYLFDINVFDNEENILAASLKLQQLSPYIVYRNGVKTAVAIHAETTKTKELGLKKDSSLELEKIQIALLANQSSASVCLHRSNSVAIAVRGLAASNCIEADIVVGGNNIDVNHPPAKSTGLNLSFLLNMVEQSKGSIWLDAKNIQSAEHCLKLANTLSKRTLNKVLVEFPSDTDFHDEGIQQCLSQLHSLNINTAYYTPTGQAKKCLEAQDIKAESCVTFIGNTLNSLSLGVQQISFDASVYSVIKELSALDDVVKNTWFMDYTDIETVQDLVDNDNFNMIILTSKDSPNKN